MAAVAAAFVTGCGGESGEPRDRRSLDLCSLAEPGEVAQVDPVNDRAATDHVSPHYVRDIEIGGRQAAVNYQRGGDCDVWLKFRDAEMGIHINTARNKTDVELGDTSPASCDVQLPLLNLIVARADLP